MIISEGKSKAFLISVALLLFWGSAEIKVGAANPPTTTFDSVKVESMVLPEVPDGLKTPQERAAFLSLNYWSALNPEKDFDSSRRTFIETSFVDFIQLFPLIDKETEAKALDNMFKKFEVSLQGYYLISDVAFKYLYEPESPYYNETYYISVLKRQIESTLTDKFEKQRPEFLLECALKNRPGELATDFTFETQNGDSLSLMQFNAPKVILIFYDPDCHHCKEVIGKLADSSGLNSLIEEGAVKVLAIYPFDDFDAWHADLSDMPSNWTVGINSHSIDSEQLYVFSVLPSLYLLDGEKKVLLKEATPAQIFKKI